MKYITFLVAVLSCFRYAGADDDTTNRYQLSMDIDINITGTLYTIDKIEYQNFIIYTFIPPLNVIVTEIVDRHKVIWTAISGQECIGAYLAITIDNKNTYLHLFVSLDGHFRDLYFKKQLPSNEWIESKDDVRNRILKLEFQEESTFERLNHVSLDIADITDVPGVSVIRVDRGHAKCYALKSTPGNVIATISDKKAVIWKMSLIKDRVSCIFILFEDDYPSLVKIKFQPYGSNDICFKRVGNDWLRINAYQCHSLMNSYRDNNVFLSEIGVTIDINEVNPSNDSIVVNKCLQYGANIYKFIQISNKPTVKVIDDNTAIWTRDSMDENCLDIILVINGHISLLRLVISTSSDFLCRYFQRTDGNLWKSINKSTYDFKWFGIRLKNYYDKLSLANLKELKSTKGLKVDISKRVSFGEYSVLLFNNNTTIQYTPFHNCHFSQVVFNDIVIWQQIDKQVPCIEVFVTVQKNIVILVHIRLYSVIEIVNEFFLRNGCHWTTLGESESISVLSRIYNGEIINTDAMVQTDLIELNDKEHEECSCTSGTSKNLLNNQSFKTKHASSNNLIEFETDSFKGNDKTLGPSDLEIDILQSTADTNCNRRERKYGNSGAKIITYKPKNSYQITIVYEGQIIIWKLGSYKCSLIDVIFVGDTPLLMHFNLMYCDSSKNIYFERLSSGWKPVDHGRYKIESKKLKNGQVDVTLDINTRNSTNLFNVKPTKTGKQGYSTFIYTPCCNTCITRVVMSEHLLWANQNDEICDNVSVIQVNDKILVNMSIVNSYSKGKHNHYVYENKKWNIIDKFSYQTKLEQ